MKDAKDATPDTTITITSRVDPLWFEFCDSVDVFGRDYCGPYMRGAGYEENLGWLVWEHGDNYAPPDREPNRTAALKAWLAGEPLPKDWHRLDKAAALKAWEMGVRWRGEKWFENGDGPAYQYAIQMARGGVERDA